ncbi:hypothetical protein OIV19_21575 [Brucella sp. HL-2]|nr:hypothetical protein [Brucella sp. HL-2]MCV9910189.1 hypothetical protein [Brucella sp. HL-2]
MTLKKGMIITAALAIPTALAAGAVVALRTIVEIDPAQHEVGDIIEVSCLPADHRLLDATLDIPAEIGGTADIGILTGSFDDKEVDVAAPRVLDGLIFAEAALGAGIMRVTRPQALSLPVRDTHRGIGVEVKTPPTAKGSFGITLYYSA